MNLRMTAIVKILISQTWNTDSRKDCLENMANFFGYSITAKTLEHRLNQKDMLLSNAIAMLDFLEYQICIVDDGEEKVIKSTKMALDEINAILKKKNITKAELSRKLGVGYIAVIHYFTQSEMKTETAVKLFNLIGCDMIVKSKKGSGTIYTVCDEDFESYKLEKMQEEAICMLNGKPIGHYDFFNEFIKNCVDIDWRGEVPIDDLYQKFESYWYSHPEIRPARSYGNRSNLIGKITFRGLLSDRFSIDKTKCYGVKLKGVAQ